MSFIFRKFKMVLLLLLVAAYSYGQARDEFHHHPADRSED